MNAITVDSKYRIERLLGQGGMGAVYEARHLGTGRRVALKVILPAILPAAFQDGGDTLARFQREARASGAIDSQHVVQVLDTGVDPATSSPYLVMEYLNGEDLQHVIHRQGPLPIAAALRVVGQACTGLVHAHGEGIIHRDIKSANLFIARREGGDLSVKILDFGIAKVRADPLSSDPTQALTRTGALLGSPLYMSPEQAVGAKSIDARSDLFSLGITLYEALCGVTPNHECETFGKLVLAISGGRGVPLGQRAPSLAPEVRAIVDKALALDPEARFQTANEMLAAICALLPQGLTLNPSMFEMASSDTKSEGTSPNVGRTFPLLSPVPPSPSAPASDNELVPVAVGTTATSFTGTNPSHRRAPRWRLLALGAPLLALCGLAVGIYVLRRSAGPSGTTTTASAWVDGSMMVESSAATASVTVPPTTILLGTEDVDASAAPAPPASAPVPVVRTRPPVAPNGAARPARQSCDPPYTFNADGKKIWKRECL